MSLTSNLFIIFVAVCLLVYYLVPKKLQWIVLLGFSYLYYVSASAAATLFLVFSTLITYGCSLWIEHTNQVTEDKKRAKSNGKKILILGLVLNLGVLAVLKYSNFMIGNVNTFFKADITLFDFILPLGISYYTFQSVGYLLDVYWERTKAEKNVFKYGLFVSFFPQILQGPIGRYGRLADQLYAQHAFSIHNMKYGIERVLWGLFKKMVLADWAAVYSEAIFNSPDQYSGIAAFGVLLYSVELYGNFSGGIDMMIGIASMFGITMDENFKRPFFAVSITDFWHRWHITLGTWMKDYVFYPLSLSKVMKKCGKAGKKLLGKKAGRKLPVSLSNVVVFFLVGLWHGPTWVFIGWGLYNGIIIAASSFLEPVYEIVKRKLHIPDKTKAYHVFMVLRTFFIINMSWYFECVDSWKTALKMIGYSFTQFVPSQFLSISSGKLGVGYTPYALATIIVGCLILFVVGILQERGVRLRDTLSRTHFTVQFAVCLAALICISLFSPMAAARGFLYAQF